MKKLLLLLPLFAVCTSAISQSGLSRAPGQAPQGAAPAGGVQPLTAPALTAPAQAQARTFGLNPVPTPLPSNSGQAAMPGVAGAPPADLRREALDRIAPMTEQEILDLRRDLDKRTQAMQQPLDAVARPVRRQINLDISPGSPPEVIRSAYSQGSVVSFVDAAGRPWPVLHADNFAPNGFDIATFGTNGVSVGVKSTGVRAGNIAVLLEGMSAPVTFSVVTGQREVDYNVEVHLPRYLPNAPIPTGSLEQVQSLAAADLMDFLLNTPPQYARPLVVDAGNVKAWQVSAERMVVRTDALLASPAWQRRQSSASGISVYDLPITPVVLMANQGQYKSVRVTGFTATREQR